MAKPTYQDADLLIKMAQWNTALGIPEILNWIWSDAFITDYEEFTKKYPQGSEEFRKVIDLLGWYETLGTLYKNGLFNEELLFDWLLIGPHWKRLEGIALGQRKARGNPRIFENFEAMAIAESNATAKNAKKGDKKTAKK
jgi:hypothetical protein